MMDERNPYPHEELKAAMICTMIVKDLSTHCLVRSISLDSAVIEWPLSDEVDHPIEVGDLVALGDILSGPKALFRGDVGKVAWIYKRTLGLQFETIHKESAQDLRDWLEEQNLV